MGKSKLYIYNKDLADGHKSYLEHLLSEEVDRMKTIESKVLSIIGQSGLIISLLAFALNSIKEIGSRSLFGEIVLTVFYILALLSFLVGVIQASRVLNIKKFRYVHGSVDTVLTNHATLDLFNKDVIEDMIYAYGVNTTLNNTKGTHLLHARFFFIGGLTLTGLLGIAMALIMMPWCRLFCFY